MIPYPRLYVNGQFERLVHPVSLSITENIIPLSTASITLPKDEQLPPGSYLELFTPYGSAGMYRVRNPKNAYGDDTTSAELEHIVSEVGDYLVKDEISEMMDGIKAIESVFRYYEGKQWVLGDIRAIGRQNIAVEAKYAGVLDTILEIMEQAPETMMTFDFSSKPWKINIVPKGETVAFEGRLARNMTSASISYDDTDLVTRVWYETFDDDGEGTWTFKDASTIGTYGIVEKKVSTSSDMEDYELDATVDSYLMEHKEPKVSITIQAIELAQITGESMDKFQLGKLGRLALPDYGVTVERNIRTITWSDVYGNPKAATVALGDQEDTVVTFLHNLDTTGSGSSSGGKAAEETAEKWKEYNSKWEVTDSKISGAVWKIDRAGNILEQAGLDIDSKGVLVYADDNVNMLGAKFNVTAAKIEAEVEDRKEGEKTIYSNISQTARSIRLEVTNSIAGVNSTITQTASAIRMEVKNTTDNLSSRIIQQADKISLVVDDNNNLKTASIVAGINGQSGSFIKLSADKIDLSGYVTAGQLTTTNGRIDNLIGGNTTFTNLYARSAHLGTQSGDVVYIYGQQVRTYTVKDTGGTNRQVFGYAL